MDEIKNSVINLNDNNDNSVEYIVNKYKKRQFKQPNKNLVGIEGVFVFNFRVKGATSNQLPTLNFIYKKSWESDGNFTTVEILVLIRIMSLYFYIFGSLFL